MKWLTVLMLVLVAAVWLSAGWELRTLDYAAHRPRPAPAYPTREPFPPSQPMVKLRQPRVRPDVAAAVTVNYQCWSINAAPIRGLDSTERNAA